MGRSGILCGLCVCLYDFMTSQARCPLSSHGDNNSVGLLGNGPVLELVWPMSLMQPHVPGRCMPSAVGTHHHGPFVVLSVLVLQEDVGSQGPHGIEEGKHSHSDEEFS